MANRKIFISYRREDTSGESGRLKDHLEREFGKGSIFYDVETLEAGLNFDQSISLALRESQVLLAMIGPHWLKVKDSEGNARIQGVDDWVKKEISLALQRDIRVIPILVNGAQMPKREDLPDELKELAFRNAKEISSSRWAYDVDELAKVLKKLIIPVPEPTPEPEPKPIPFQPKSDPIANFIDPNSSPNIKYRNWLRKNYKWVLGAIVLLYLLNECSTMVDTSYPATYEGY